MTVCFQEWWFRCMPRSHSKLCGSDPWLHILTQLQWTLAKNTVPPLGLQNKLYNIGWLWAGHSLSSTILSCSKAFWSYIDCMIMSALSWDLVMMKELVYLGKPGGPVLVNKFEGRGQKKSNLNDPCERYKQDYLYLAWIRVNGIHPWSQAWGSVHGQASSDQISSSAT